MNTQFKQTWLRFSSNVPAAEKKLQLILGVAAASFGSIAAINWPGKLAAIATIAGYIAAACAGMAFLLQFAMQTQTIVQTQNEVKISTTSTTTTTAGTNPQQ